MNPLFGSRCFYDLKNSKVDCWNLKVKISWFFKFRHCYISILWPCLILAYNLSYYVFLSLKLELTSPVRIPIQPSSLNLPNIICYYLRVCVKPFAHWKSVNMFMTIIVLKIFPTVATFTEKKSSDRGSINGFNIILMGSGMTACAIEQIPNVHW